MGGLDLVIRTTRLLCQRDKILTAATEELNREFVDVAFFLLTLVCQAFEGNLEVTQTRLAQIWSEWADLAGDEEDRSDRLGDILGHLVSDGVLHDGGADFVIAVDCLPTAVCGLYFDQKHPLTCP